MNASQTVLIVEAEDALRKILAEAITEQGYNVAEAMNGEEAWQFTKEHRPSLILLEVMLPKLNGFTFLKRLRNHKKLKSTPVIVLSNLGQPADIAEANALGVIDYLVKSNHTIQAIAQRVVTALQHHESTQSN